MSNGRQQRFFTKNKKSKRTEEIREDNGVMDVTYPHVTDEFTYKYCTFIGKWIERRRKNMLCWSKQQNENNRIACDCTFVTLEIGKEFQPVLKILLYGIIIKGKI